MVLGIALVFYGSVKKGFKLQKIFKKVRKIGRQISTFREVTGKKLVGEGGVF